MQSATRNGFEVQDARSKESTDEKIEQYGGNKLGSDIPCTGPNQNTPGGDCYSQGGSYCHGCRTRRINALIAMEKWERYCASMFTPARIEVILD